MAYGLELRNNNGGIGFNTNNTCFSLAEKRFVTGQLNTRTGPSATGQWYSYVTTITSVGGAPLAFAKPTASGGSVTSRLVSVSGNDYTYEFCTSDTQSGDRPQLQLYIFTEGPGPVAGGGYGLETYDENGNLLFSTSGRRTLKISGYYITAPLNQPSGNPIPAVNLAAGSVPSNYAVATQNLGFRFVSTPTSAFIWNSIVLGFGINSSGQLVYSDTVIPQNILSGFFLLNTYVYGNLYVPIIDTSLYD